MPSGIAVWGIDLGQCALKAIKLRPAGDGQVEAMAFDIIEHPKILSQPDAEPDELLQAALEKFVSRNDWQRDQFVIGVPGQQTFARFCKMPPVDPKKLPDLVRFEASQQIPFDMEDVVWDYQIFSAPDSPDVEVGIFAIRKDLIRKRMEFFSRVGITPIAVQTIPSALYNFCRFDLGADEGQGATVVIDVGAQNTDLVIAQANGTWTRNIPLGGNNFTEALIKAFKLSFAKAESLKKTAATSKYARQIFQAMRPVFAELVSEIQRSIGFYSSTHRDVELQRVLALGSAFRLPGLQKYLENNLTIPGGVTKLEKFNAVVPSATLNAPQFSDNLLSFGAAYGLALQGLGLAPIAANLLPTELARIALWSKKRPYFLAAAACLGLAAAFPWARHFIDQAALAAGTQTRADAQRIVAEAKRYQEGYRQVKTNTAAREADIQKLLELQKHQRLIPQIVALVHEAMPELDPELAKVQTRAQLKQLIESDKARFARTQRKQIFIDSCRIQYHRDIDAFQAGEVPGTDSRGGVMVGGPAVAGGGGRLIGGARPMVGDMGEDTGWADARSGAAADQTAQPSSAQTSGFYVFVEGRLLHGDNQADAASLLTQEYFERLRKLGEQPGLGFYVPDEDRKSQDKQKENMRLLFIRRYFDQAAGLMGDLGPAAVSAWTGNVRAAAPAAAGTEDARAKLLEDPLTGESMGTDWRFQIGFKIRMGEKPQTPSEPTQKK